MKILFVTSNRLGDAVLSTGLLSHLLQVYPQARFTIVCGPVAEDVFARMPNRDRTIVLRKRRWGLHWLPLWAETAMIRWSLVVDIRGSALSWLVPTRRRAVFRRSNGPKITQLGFMLGLSPPPLPVVWVDASDERRLAALLPSGRPIVVLAPTANWQPKIWPATRFAQTFATLAETRLPGALAVVLAGPGAAERAMAEPLLVELPEALDLVGVLTLTEVMALLQRASLFIGNDSGLMHLAAAAGAPTIGLFGPTDAATYAPAGRWSRAVVKTSMDAISVPDVTEAIARLLAVKI